MPLFDYKCDICKQVDEKLESYSDISAKDCKFCGNKGTMYRTVSLTSFVLSGSGWYRQGYENKK